MPFHPIYVKSNRSHTLNELFKRIEQLTKVGVVVVNIVGGELTPKEVHVLDDEIFHAMREFTREGNSGSRTHAVTNDGELGVGPKHFRNRLVDRFV